MEKTSDISWGFLLPIYNFLIFMLYPSSAFILQRRKLAESGIKAITNVEENRQSGQISHVLKHICLTLKTIYMERK